jgi:hypothetical protein
VREVSVIAEVLFVAVAINMAKVRLKKDAVIFKLNISTVNPKIKNPKTKHAPINPEILMVAVADWLERQKIYSGTK